MSDYTQAQYDDEYDEQPEPQQQRTRTVPRDVWKDMERKAKERDEVAKQLEAANRRLAFADAGINTSDARLAYFVKGYDGDLTPDAIRTAAAEAGFIDAPAPEVPTEELRAHDRVTQAAAGGNAGVTEDVLEGARRAASAARPGEEAQAYADYLRSKGADKMRMSPH